MSHEQRNLGRGFRKDFQHNSQNSQYRNERAGSDSNQTSVKTIHEGVVECIAHDMENCSVCVRTAKKCHVMLASELTLKCGCKLPVVADACQVHNERMPVCIVMMGDQSVSVLRDAGCSTVLVKRKLVNDERMTRLEAQAVATRARARQQVKSIKPLKVIENLGDDVTREKLIALEGQDPSLAKSMKEAGQNQKAGRSEVYFKMKDEILYRY